MTLHDRIRAASASLRVLRRRRLAGQPATREEVADYRSALDALEKDLLDRELRGPGGGGDCPRRQDGAR